MTVSLRVKFFKVAIALLAIFFNLFQPLVIALSISPASAFANEVESNPSTDISFSFNSSENIISVSDTNSSDKYQLIYQRPNDQGEAISEMVSGTSSEIYLGTCSKNICTPHQLLSGSLLLPDLHIYRDFVISNDQLWYKDGDRYTLSDSVSLSNTYSYPDNSHVQVTFSHLPTNPGHLSIQKINLTEEEKVALGALDNTAYDITSDMPNGSFKFDLKLPLPTNHQQNLQLAYAQNTSDLVSNPTLVVDGLNVTDTKLSISNLDHMTIFVVTVPSPVALDCSDSGLISITSSDTCYNTIQTALDNAVSGDTIEVASGVYSENLVINQANITLLAPAGKENTKIVGSADRAIHIKQDGVEINGFTIENPTGKFGIFAKDVSGLSIKNNLIKNITNSSEAVYGIGIISTNNTISNLDITGNQIEDLNGDLTTSGIFFGWDSTTLDIANPIISNNHITNIKSNSGSAFGILIRHTTSGALIQGNTISNIQGVWPRGIGLNSDTPSAQVLSNTISNLTVNSGFSSQSKGVLISNNLADDSTIKINLNLFSLMDFGIYDTINTSITKIDATKNWWGDSSGPNDSNDLDTTSPDTNPGSGSKVYGNLDYSNWLGSDTPPSQVTGIRILDHEGTDLGCGSSISNRSITVDWVDNPESNIHHYDYMIREETIISQPTVSEYSGNIRDEDSDYKYRARAVDNAGREGEWSEWCGVTLDRTLPGIPAQTGYNQNDGDPYSSPRPVNELSCNGGYTNVNGVSVHWTDEASTGTNVKYQRQYSVGSGNWSGNEIYTNPYTNYRSFGGGSGTENTYGSRVRSWEDYNDNNQIDFNENVSEWSNSCSITFDNTAPDVSITEPTTSPLNGTVAIKGTITDNNPDHYWFVIQNSSGSNVAGPGTVYSSPQTFTDHLLLNWDTSGIPDGDYTIKLEARDAANNKDSGSVAWQTITIDNTAPDKPTNLARTGSDGNIYQCTDYSKRISMNPFWDDMSVSDPSFDHYEYTSFHPNGNIGLSRKVLYTPMLDGGGWVAPEDGTYGFAVRSVDKAGNTSDWASSDETLAGSCQINYDSAPPTTPTVLGFLSPTLSCGSITNITATTVDWDDSTDSGSGFAEYEYYIDYPKTDGTRGQWSTTLTNSQRSGSLNEGLHQIKVRAKDNVGNFSDWSNTCEITADWTSPTVSSSVSPVSPDGDNSWYKTTPEITLTATDETALDRIEYHWDTDSWSTYSSKLTPSEGTHTLYFKSYDKAGNTSSEESLTLKFDQTQPTSPPSLDVTDKNTNTAKVTWQDSTDNISIDHYNIRWNLDGSSTVYSEDVASNILEKEIDNLVEGDWYVKVTAVDPAGNTNYSDKTFDLTYPASSPASSPSPSPSPSPTLPLGGVQNFTGPEVLGATEDLTSPEKITDTGAISQGNSGDVKGVNTETCSTFSTIIPLILLLLQALSLLLFKFFRNNYPKITKNVAMVSITLLSILIFWIMNRTGIICTPDNLFWRFTTLLYPIWSTLLSLIIL